MSRTGVYGGDEVLGALERLGGEAQTDEIAQEASMREVRALTALGAIGAKGHVVKCERGNKKGNPRWRLPLVGEEGFTE